MPRHSIATLILSLLLAAPLTAKTAEPEGGAAKPAVMPSPPQREVQSLYDGQDSYEPIEETPPERRIRKLKSGLGGQFSFYYDGLSNVARTMNVNSGTPMNFFSQNITGMTGIQILGTLWRGDWEFSSGIDYTLPFNVESAQPVMQAGYNVNSQDFESFGVKLLQVGYRIPQQRINLVPYAGLGMSYGKNVLKVWSSTFGGENVISHVKVMANFIAGIRIDFNLLPSGGLAAGLSLEAFQPVTLANHLEQNAGKDAAYLQNNNSGTNQDLSSRMDFMNSTGGRIMATVAGYF